MHPWAWLVVYVAGSWAGVVLLCRWLSTLPPTPERHELYQGRHRL